MFRRHRVVVLLLANQNTTIRSLRVFEGEIDKALAGENVGITVDNSAAVKRGDIFLNISMPKVSATFQALILCLKDKLELNVLYTLQCVTQELGCKIERIEEQININTLQSCSSDSLNEADIGKIRIVTNTPLVYEEFNTLSELGRFVLRKEADIVGAGIIV